MNEVLYAVSLTVAVMVLAIIMVTGAFFSRSVGTKLAMLGNVACGVAIFAAGASWWVTGPALLVVLFIFLFLASLGGEK